MSRVCAYVKGSVQSRLESDLHTRDECAQYAECPEHTDSAYAEYAGWPSSQGIERQAKQVYLLNMVVLRIHNGDPRRRMIPFFQQILPKITSGNFPYKSMACKHKHGQSAYDRRTL